MSKLKILRKDDLNPVVAVIVGTRPSIVKMAPLIRELSNRGLPFFVIHAGQHYSVNMDQKMFEDLELPQPRYHLTEVRQHKTHGAQTAAMLVGIEGILLKEKPRLVFVCGDANFNLAGALAARKLQIDVAHTESGLRSFDWVMPEEHNRVMIDHISDYLFAPTDQCRRNLLRESVRGRIEVVGNTIVDSISQNREIAIRRSDVLSRLSLEEGKYILCTVHREENVDNRERFSSILHSIASVADQCDTPVIYPIHPRSKQRLQMFGLDESITGESVRVIEPLGYLDFLNLLIHARLVLTDSGGVQEEACILRVPCVTLRDNTERPETVAAGSNIVAGVEVRDVLAAVNKMLQSERVWKNPFGDGKASMRMVDTVEHYFD